MFVLHGELDVHQADDLQLAREVLRGADDFRFDRIAQRKRWDHTGRVARVDAGLLDVFHDRADDRGFAVADAIDIDFRRVVEEAVDQHRALG